MAGRPKREEEVTPVLLRIPPALLKRVERCQALLQLREDTRYNRTEAFWRIIEAGCEVVEGAEVSKISEISPLTIFKISEISNHGLSAAGPEASRTTKSIPNHIQRIVEARAQYEKLSLRDFAQLLFDRNIYRAHDKDGQEKPVNAGTLGRWLEDARKAGLL